MKKLAIGCGIALLVCIIAAGALGFWLYMKARPYIQSAQQFAELAKINDEISNKSPFTAPANGELTEGTVRRFVAVQDSMRAKLGARVDELTKTQEELNRLQNSEHRQATPREAFSVITGMMGLVVQAKTAQIQALNDARFSMEEYEWVRNRVYAAAGVSIAQLDLDKLGDAMKNGRALPDKSDAPTISESVPERNKALVQPLLPKLKEWMPFAFFGL